MDRMAILSSSIDTAGPGTLIRFDIHVDPLMIGKRTIMFEHLATASESTPITFGSMFAVLMQHNLGSSVASEVALLVVTLELAMFVVLVVVSSQYGMSLETVGTLATSPLGSAGMVCIVVSVQQIASINQNEYKCS